MTVSTEPSVYCGADCRPLSAVRQRAARMAAGMHNCGIGPQDRVAVVMRNDIAQLEVTLAIGLLGAVPVAVNWHWTGDDLAHVLANSGAKLAVAHSDLLPGTRRQAPSGMKLAEAPLPAAVTAAYSITDPELTETAPVVEDWVQQYDPWPESSSQPPMSVIYTSGTTGLAKGVLRQPITPDHLPAITKTLADLLHLAPGRATLLPAPLYHSAPNVHMTFAAALGMDIHIMPRFDAEAFLRAIHDHKISSVQVVPTMFARLLQLPSRVRRAYDVSSLERVVHAAAPCPPETKRAMIDWLGPIIYEYYGGTEVGVLTICDSDDAISKPGTVGRPIADAHIVVLDDAGNEVAVGTDGIVYGRPFTGWPDFTYIDDAAKRRAVAVGDHVTLGDVGHLDADGYLYISDRINDMVVSGGVNIYPAEVESCLMSLDGVADVAVFGVPDEDLGEVLAAHVQLRDGARLTGDDIRAHVAARLARYKTPRIVAFVDSLPREDTGKLFKRRLREQYLQEPMEKAK